jgi:hypothetical protein
MLGMPWEGGSRVDTNDIRKNWPPITSYGIGIRHKADVDLSFER